MARTKVSSTKTPKEPQKARKSIGHLHIQRLGTKKISQGSIVSPYLKKRSKKNKYDSKVLSDIRKFQDSTKLLVPRAPMIRCIRETIQGISRSDLRVTAGAVEAIREAVEAYLVDMFEICNLLAIHAKRKTVMPKDITLWKQITKMMTT